MKKTNEIPATLQEIMFDVEINDNPRNTNTEYCKVVTGLIDGEEIDLNYCSDRYELVPNAEIFPVVRQILLNKGIQFTEHYSHINNARFYANYVIEDQRYAYRVGGSADVVKPMLKVQHSYNGLTKYMITFGYYRLVCSNGLVIPVEEMKEYNLSMVGKHTKSIKDSLQKLNATLTYFAENAAQITLAITAKYETLAGNYVEKWEDRVLEVLNTNKIAVVEGSKNTVSHITSTILKEADLYGGRVNDWLIYNAVNRYIYDDAINAKAPEARAELDRKVFESLLN
jgi:hypothetical protein